MLKNEQIQFIVNTTEGKRAIEESRSIRTTALRYRVTYLTTIAGAQASCNALAHLNKSRSYSLPAGQHWDTTGRV